MTERIAQLNQKTQIIVWKTFYLRKTKTNQLWSLLQEIQNWSIQLMQPTWQEENSLTL